ncbi:hypothetical protein V2J09_006084 [Rumex salicifolius]
MSPEIMAERTDRELSSSFPPPSLNYSPHCTFKMQLNSLTWKTVCCISFSIMSPEEENGGGPLDLNNLPEDFTRDGKQASEDTSSSGTVQRKKKGGSSRNGKDESGKVYECRFCSLKFCKSQALGGHMNRHRQERETESLNKARQLVFGTENLATAAPYSPFPPPLHLQQGGGGYHHHQSAPLMYPARMFSGGSGSGGTPPHSAGHHHQQPLLYQAGPPLVPYPSQYPPPPHHHHHHHPDYFLGESSTNYTCIGAPVAGPHGGGGFMLNSSGSSATHHHHHQQPPVNRFQDTAGF